MCDCEKKIIEDFLDGFQEQYVGEDHKIIAKHQLYITRNLSMNYGGVTEFEGTYTRTLKNGKKKKKTITQCVAHKYCPFCGQLYEATS